MTIKKKVLVSVPGRFHAFNLAEELAKKPDLTVILHTSYPRWIVSKFIDTSNIKVESCSYAEYFFRIAKKIFRTNFIIRSWYHYLFIRSQLKTLKSQQYDIFIGFAGVSYESILYAKSSGIKTFLERGSTHIKMQARLLNEAANHSNEKLSFKINKKELLEYDQADYIVTPTDFTCESFKNYNIPVRKIIKIPYGVDVNAFNPIEFERPKKPMFCFAGGGSTRKGYTLLLDVMEELQNRDVNLHHYGGISKYCLKYFRKKPRPNVIRFGNLPQEKLPEAYSKSSCLILPTFEEGMALVLIQSVRMGLHIITTKNSGCLDLMKISPSQFTIIDPGNKLMLKKAMLNHIEMFQSQIYIDEKARDAVVKDFSWLAYGDRYYNTIELLT